MRVLVVTVAGLSSRFSQSLGREQLKCIYYENHISESLLYRMLHQEVSFDKYIIVGGFRFFELEETLERHFSDMRDRICLVENKKYAEYGSGYSLYLGLEAAKDMDFDEIVFAEGDLYVDGKSFLQVCSSDKSVITCSPEAIRADKAVAFYYDMQYRIHYIFDTNHHALEIKEPFLGIFNSGQIWKFRRADGFRECFAEMRPEDWKGTNLVFIQKFFAGLGKEQYEVVAFRKWINCNTVEDFRLIHSFGVKGYQ